MLKAAKFSQVELLVVKDKPKIDTPVILNVILQTQTLKSLFIKTGKLLNRAMCSHFQRKAISRLYKLPNLRSLLTKGEISYPSTKDKPNKIRSTFCTGLGKYTYCPLNTTISDIKCKITHKTYPLIISLHTIPVTLYT